MPPIRPKSLSKLIAIAVTLAAVGGSGLIASTFFLSGVTSFQFNLIALVSVFLPLLAVVLAYFFGVRGRRINLQEMEAARAEYVTQLEERREEVRRQVLIEAPPEISTDQLGRVLKDYEIGLEASEAAEENRRVTGIINTHQTQALLQASVQFWFSIGAATVGFALIGFVILQALSTGVSETLLTTIPGIAIEGVAALFFRQASETRERATSYYDRLRVDNRQRSARLLAKGIENREVRDAIKAKLALAMTGNPSSAKGNQGKQTDSVLRISDNLLSALLEKPLPVPKKNDEEDKAL